MYVLFRPEYPVLGASPGGGWNPPLLDSLRVDSHRGRQGAQTSHGHVTTATLFLVPLPQAGQWARSTPSLQGPPAPPLSSLAPPPLLLRKQGGTEAVALGRRSMELSRSPKSTGCRSPAPKTDAFEV